MTLGEAKLIVSHSRRFKNPSAGLRYAKAVEPFIEMVVFQCSCNSGLDVCVLERVLFDAIEEHIDVSATWHLFHGKVVSVPRDERL